MTVLPSGRQSSTSSDGAFAVDGLPAGRAVIFVRAIGHSPVQLPLMLENDSTVIEVVLAARPVQLADLVVRYKGKIYSGRAAEIAQRSRTGVNPPTAFVDRAELEEWGRVDLANVFRRVGLRVADKQVACPRSGKIGQAIPKITVYVDGQLYQEGLSFAVDLVPVDWLEAIEVYRSGAARPIQYSHTGSLCSVLLWTR